MLIPAGAKKIEEKTPILRSSARIEKPWKYYVSEDPNLDPNSSDSISRDSYPSNNSNYKHRRCHKNEKNRNARNRNLSNYAWI